jgi:molybdopterin converting factor small subunit
MKIKIRLVGRYQEIINKQELELTISPPATIWNIVDLLFQKYPTLEKNKKFIIVSRNNTFSSMKTPVADGDVITISPPIVGGG